MVHWLLLLLQGVPAMHEENTCGIVLDRAIDIMPGANRMLLVFWHAHVALRVLPKLSCMDAASLNPEPWLGCKTWLQVIERIACDVLPVIRQGGLAGQAEYVTKSPLFSAHPVAIDMLVDVLTDRCAGPHAADVGGKSE